MNAMQETAGSRLGSSGSSELHAMAQARVRMAALACSICGWYSCLSPLVNFSLLQNRGDVRCCLAAFRILFDQVFHAALVTLFGSRDLDR